MTKKITIDNLAKMIKGGFDDVDKRFNDVDKRFDRIEVNLSNLQIDHEDIKLKLDRVAYRFEIEELQKRVDLLEKLVLPKAKKSDLVLK